MDPEGLFTFLVLRPLSDLFLWLWRLERRLEFLYRPQFDKWLRPPLFDFAQKLQNARREDERLALAEERTLPGEDQYTQEIIDELAKFTRENWLPGGAQRFGNTKTFGVLRAEFMVLPDVPAGLRHGLFAEPRTYPAWVRFSGPGKAHPRGIGPRFGEQAVPQPGGNVRQDHELGAQDAEGLGIAEALGTPGEPVLPGEFGELVDDLLGVLVLAWERPLLRQGETLV